MDKTLVSTMEIIKAKGMNIEKLLFAYMPMALFVLLQQSKEL